MINTGYDLVIFGGNADGVSLAISSQKSGLKRVRIIEPGSSIAFPDLVGEQQSDVGYGETVTAIERDATVDVTLSDPPPCDLVVTTTKGVYRARAVVIAERTASDSWKPAINVTPGERILIDQIPENPIDQDVLVIGYTDHAVEIARSSPPRALVLC
ncbi:MAG: hypothetical protein R2735_04730 [Microthrixaceae bacterium]